MSNTLTAPEAVAATEAETEIPPGGLEGEATGPIPPYLPDLRGPNKLQSPTHQFKAVQAPSNMNSIQISKLKNSPMVSRKFAPKIWTFFFEKIIMLKECCLPPLAPPCPLRLGNLFQPLKFKKQISM